MWRISVGSALLDGGRTLSFVGLAVDFRVAITIGGSGISSLRFFLRISLPSRCLAEHIPPTPLMLCDLKSGEQK
jgi:hypothetical protein